MKLFLNGILMWLEGALQKAGNSELAPVHHHLLCAGALWHLWGLAASLLSTEQCIYIYIYINSWVSAASSDSGGLQTLGVLQQQMPPWLTSHMQLLGWISVAEAGELRAQELGVKTCSYQCLPSALKPFDFIISNVSSSALPVWKRSH